MIKKKVNFWTIIKISKGKRIESKGGKYVGRKAFFFFFDFETGHVFFPYSHYSPLSFNFIFQN
jgi:hypothetical protein